MDILIYIIIGLVIGFVAGRRRSFARSFRNDGEAYLSRELHRHFTAPDYHLMNHITLKLEDGTTQIDHILVSKFGIFVIETKDYSGWIFANAKHSHWTQVLYHWKSRFQNPIFQNYRHVKAIQEILDFLPADNIMSAVVFVGRAEFKTEVPPGVFYTSEFVDFVRNKTTEIMSLNRVQFSVGRLETIRLAISNKTDVEHIESLRRKYGSSD